MKVIIDIPKSTYEYYLKLVANDDVMNNPEKIIVNGTPINDNATNGDMIKAMFCQYDLTIRFRTSGEVIVDMKGLEKNGLIPNMAFDESWWNAPYKGV